jgi:hypothetical protein
VWICCALVAAAGIAGCGDLGSAGVTERVDAPQLLSSKDLARYPENSPARVVLEWWRALQFQALDQASGYYARAAAVKSSTLKRQLTLPAGVLNLDARPAVADVARRGNRATVFVVLTRVAVQPNGRREFTKFARSFEVVREDGVWRLRDNSYLKTLEDRAASFIKLAGAQRRKREAERRKGPG